MKLMRLMRKCKGSISIFLCLILLPMVTYATLIIDASRLQSARVAVSTAGDLTMNAALSEYEQVLEDMYGIFAVAQTEGELKDSLMAYYQQTIESSLIGSEAEDEYAKMLSEEIVDMVFSEEGFDYDNFLQMKLEDFSYEPVPGTELANPAMLKRQIIDYMKYKGPLSVVSTLMPKLDFLKDSSKQTEVLTKKVEYTEQLNSLNDPCSKAYNAIVGSIVDNERKADGYNSYAGNYNNLLKDFKTSVTAAIEEAQENFKYMSECDILRNNCFLLTAPITFEGLWAESGGQDEIDKIYDPNTKLYEMDKKELYDLLVSVSSAYSEIIALDTEKSGGLFSDNIDEVSIYETQPGNAGKLDSAFTVGIRRREGNLYPSIATIGEYGSWIAILDAPEKENSISLFERRFDFQQGFAGHDLELQKFVKWYQKLQKFRTIYDDVFEEYEMRCRLEAEKKTGSADSDLIDIELESDENYVARLNSKKMIDTISEEIKLTYYDEFADFLKKLNDCDIYNTGGRLFCDAATELLFRYRDALYSAEVKLETLNEALDTIKKTLGEIDKTKESWQKSIDSLSSKSSTRSSMQSDFDTTTESFDEEDVTALQEAANARISQIKALIEQLETVKYLDATVILGFGHINYMDSPYYEQYVLSNKSDPANTAAAAASHADEMIANYFTQQVMPGSFVALDLIDGQKPNGEYDDSERFFLTLKSICEPEQGKELSEEDKECYENAMEYAKVDDKDGRPVQKGDDDASGSSGGSGQQGTVSVDIGGVLQEIQDYMKDPYNDKDKDDGGSKDKSDDDDKEENYSVSAPDIKDDGKVEGQPSNSLKNATSLLSKLSDIGRTVRDNVYLEEYFTEMFTCQTDAKLKPGELILLSGYTNDDPDEAYRVVNTNTDWYGNEVEYILWGDATLKNNRVKTEALIYTIRFALNAVYAFTASDIQAFAFEAASAIAGWTVVGVPIVQACITIALALAESALDLQALKDGKDVPIYKSTTTFQCSPTQALKTLVSGAVEKAAEAVSNELDKKLDEIADKAYKTIGDAMGDITNYVNNFIDEQADGVKTAIKQQFVAPVINSITPLLSEVQNASSNADKLISDTVDTTFATIESNINSINDGTTKELIQQFYERFKSEIKSELTDKIHDYLSKVSDQASTDSLNAAISGVIDSKIDDFSGDIQHKMEEYKDNIMEKVKAAGDKPIGDLKSFMHERINDFAGDLSGKINDSFSGIDSKQLDTTSASQSFTLNYKEYCKIFVLISIGRNETAMLQRAGALMQVNVQNAVHDANPDFKLTSANTMVSVSADVKLGTLMPWAVSDEENDAAADSGLSLDFSDLGDNSISIHYNGMFGY